MQLTYLLTYYSGGVQRLLVAEMVFGPHSGSLAMLQFIEHCNFLFVVRCIHDFVLFTFKDTVT